MNKLKYLFSIFLIPFFVYSQTNVKDEKAKVILDKLSAVYSKAKTIKSTFNVKIEDQKEKTDKTIKGTISIKSKKYHLEVLDVETISDGTSVWSYQKKSNEVNITNIDNYEMSLINNPFQLLKDYSKNFKYQYIKEFSDGKTTFHEIHLYPEKLNLDASGKSSSGFSRLILKINKETNQLNSIKYVGKDGVNYDVVLTRTFFDLEIPDSFFTFEQNKYPDVEVIDLRE